MSSCAGSCRTVSPDASDNGAPKCPSENFRGWVASSSFSKTFGRKGSHARQPVKGDGCGGDEVHGIYDGGPAAGTTVALQPGDSPFAPPD